MRKMRDRSMAYCGQEERAGTGVPVGHGPSPAPPVGHLPA